MTDKTKMPDDVRQAWERYQSACYEAFTKDELIAALKYLIHNEALASLRSGGMEVVTGGCGCCSEELTKSVPPEIMAVINHFGLPHTKE